MSEHDPAVDGWELALAELEAHVALAEQMLRHDMSAGDLDWEPPADLGPIPSDLVFRARQLVKRQQALIDALPGILAATNNQRRVTARFGEATGRTTPSVYFDIAT